VATCTVQSGTFVFRPCACIRLCAQVKHSDKGGRVVMYIDHSDWKTTTETKKKRTMRSQQSKQVDDDKDRVVACEHCITLARFDQCSSRASHEQSSSQEVEHHTSNAAVYHRTISVKSWHERDNLTRVHQCTTIATRRLKTSRLSSKLSTCTVLAWTSAI
jgi:hypothetical protein